MVGRLGVQLNKRKDNENENRRHHQICIDRGGGLPRLGIRDQSNVGYTGHNSGHRDYSNSDDTDESTNSDDIEH